MTDPDDIGARVQSRHGPTLDRLGQAAGRVSDTRDTFPLSGAGGDPPSIVVPSILDSSIEVSLTAISIAIEQVPGLFGSYPAGSTLMVTTVSARNSRSGRRSVLDRGEVDAWGAALVPEEFRYLVVRLGVMTGSTSGAVHYRYVLGGDHHLCVIDDRDTARMRDNGRFR